MRRGVSAAGGRQRAAPLSAAVSTRKQPGSRAAHMLGLEVLSVGFSGAQSSRAHVRVSGHVRTFGLSSVARPGDLVARLLSEPDHPHLQRRQRSARSFAPPSKHASRQAAGRHADSTAPRAGGGSPLPTCRSLRSHQRAKGRSRRCTAQKRSFPSLLELRAGQSSTGGGRERHQRVRAWMGAGEGEGGSESAPIWVWPHLGRPSCRRVASPGRTSPGAHPQELNLRRSTSGTQPQTLNLR